MSVVSVKKVSVIIQCENLSYARLLGLVISLIVIQILDFYKESYSS